MKYMVTRSPFRSRSLSYPDFDALFEGVFGGTVAMTAKTPKVDVREEDERYILEADMPGLSREEIEVKVDNHVLTFSSVSAGGVEQDGTSGEQEESSGENGNGEEREKNGSRSHYLMRERSRPSYSRSFTLPRDADPSQIDASYSGGVLTLTIHKAEEAKPRNIKIRAS